ncbi:dirigent protein 1 [Dendrobium catenatum]|nr:dirigent protein 1 [Dendrobium catenatum]XP_028550878.1 dirigent protein 1 [Dendrobium catenatum]
MASISFTLPIFLTIFFFLTLKTIPTIETDANETRLLFYYHERTKSPNATAIKVVSSPVDPTVPIFAVGNIFVFDDPLTEGLDPASHVLGRVQGELVFASLDGYDGLYNFNIVFTDLDPWTGSTLTVIGRNPTQQTVKELPVVGGTGRFRRTRGYIILTRLTSLARPDGIITFEVNLTLWNN